MIVALVLLISGYFRNGTVYTAFQLLRKEKYERAKKELLKTKYPKWLARSQKAYYYYVSGFIALHENKLEDSLQKLSKALEIGLRTDNDKSILTLNLANIEFELGNFESAEKYISKTKEFNCSERVLSELRKLEVKMNE